MDTEKEREKEKDHEFSILDINSIVDFVKNNIIQILLFILVFIIIYIVDYIQNINAIIYAMPSPIPGMTNDNKQPNTKKIRKNKFSKK